MLDHQFEARALHLFVDQGLTFLDRGDREAWIGDCCLECFGNTLNHLFDRFRILRREFGRRQDAMAVQCDAEIAEPHDGDVILGDAKTVEAGEISDERGDCVGPALRQQGFAQLRRDIDPAHRRWIETSGCSEKWKHNAARGSRRRRELFAGKIARLGDVRPLQRQDEHRGNFVNLEHADDLGADLLAPELDQSADVGERHVVRPARDLGNGIRRSIAPVDLHGHARAREVAALGCQHERRLLALDGEIEHQFEVRGLCAARRSQRAKHEAADGGAND